MSPEVVDDAYAVLKDRDVAGTLMPTEDDYLDLEPTPEQNLSFVARVAEEAPALVAQARTQPGTKVRAVIAERLGVGLVVDVVISPGEDESLEEIWIGFEMPPQAGDVELPQMDSARGRRDASRRCIARPRSIRRYLPAPGGSRPNEIVMRWL